MKRFSIQAWAKERGFENAVKALTGNQVDELRAALQEFELATMRIDEWDVRRDGAGKTIRRYTEQLKTVADAAKPAEVATP